MQYSQNGLSFPVFKRETMSRFVTVLSAATLLFCALLPSFILPSAAHADWLEFRGPGGNGNVADTALPVKWSETENVKWKQDLPGLAWSSPVVKGDNVYLTTAVETTGDDKKPAQSLRVVCLDRASGKVQWNKEVFDQVGKVAMHKKNSHASPTPLIEGDRIYVHFGSNGTAAISLDGDVLWTTKLTYSPQHGTGGSPAVAGEHLIICCDGRDVQYVVGLNKNTGETVWKTDRDTKPKKGFSFGTPLIIEVAGKQQAVCPASEAVFAYDCKTGDQIWRVDYPGGYSVTPKPIYGHGLVYVGTSFDRPRLLAIDPTGTGDITETHVKWNLDRSMPHTPSPLIVGQHLYVVSDRGVASCLDAVSGELHWQERIEGKYSASPMHANGFVYFLDEYGTTVVVKESETFEEVSRNTVGDGERTYATYAVDGNAILLRSESALYRIEN